MKTSLLSILLLQFAAGIVSAQTPTHLETALPYVQNFSPEEYSAHPQNFAVVQDVRGVMYFGNVGGVLEYDGVSWRLIPMPNQSVVRSLSRDDDGRIYVGAQNEFGYLVLNAAGATEYVSLVDHLKPAADSSGNAGPEFGDVWQIWTTRAGVFFFTYRSLYRWTGNEIVPIRPEVGEFNRSFVIRDTVYVEFWPKGGWAKVVGDSLQPLTHLGKGRGARFALPFDATRWLIGKSTTGLSLFDGRNLQPFKTEAEAFLEERGLFQGSQLPDGSYIFTTRKGGVALIDRQGRLRRILSKESGLLGEVANAVYLDREGGVWLALDYGLARVDAMGPLSFLSDRSGLNTAVNAVVRHQGRLFTACQNGVYLFEPGSFSGTPSKFLPVSEITNSAWALLSVDGILLAGTNDGVYRVEETSARRIAPDIFVFSLYHSRRYPNRIYAGLQNGLAVLQRRDGQWQLAARFPDIFEEIRSIVEDEQGNLWLGTYNQGVLRIRLTGTALRLDSRTSGKHKIERWLDAKASGIKVQRFNQAHGLPLGPILSFIIDGTARFATSKGLRRFDAFTQSFPADSTFGAYFADTTSSVSFLAEDEKGSVWIVSDESGHSSVAVAWRQNDGSYTWDDRPFRSMTDFGDIYTIYVDSPERHDDHALAARDRNTEVVWFGGPSGLVRYDKSVAKNYAQDYAALVRRVTVNGDSVIYGDISTNGLPEPEAEALPRLAYSANALRFEYAALSFENVKANRYQVYLDGFDKDWSAWTAETHKDYTNLPEGDYRLRVRAKNIYGHVSQEGVYAFSIAPPWHRTGWAYASYAVLLGVLVFAVDRVQRRRLLKKERERAQRREAEIHLKNQLKIKQLEADQLKELDQMRSRFFANVSHEFRTPLTLILGQIENLRTAITDSGLTKKLDMAMRHARRLQELINQLLDVARLEAGKMPLRVQKADVVPFLRKLFASFESLATQKKLGIRFYAEHDRIDVYYEPEKLEKIFVNLVSNAIKFTPEGGEISSSVRVSHEDGTSGWVEIEVRDSGIGIPDDRLPYIFDRFYQVESGDTRDYEGTGIGLALVKELVELHGGEIRVTSKVGMGTVFKVRLPLGREHLSDEQIVGAMQSEEELASETATEKSRPALSTTGDKKDQNRRIILIVEDNTDMRQYIRENLQDTYAIAEAVDGEQGFEMAKELVPDLIISDVMMPGVDGYELARRIRSHELTSHVPIVMLTAKAAEEEKLEGLETGVDAYLTKPFSTRELQVRVRKLIEMRQKLFEQRKQPLKITATEIAVTPVDEEFLERLQQVVEENMEDEDFQVGELCHKIGIGERQLYRKLQALLGCTPAAYIRQIRLDRAKQLLEKGAGTVSEITFMVGYGNTSAFARAFREAFGKTPSEFLKK